MAARTFGTNGSTVTLEQIKTAFLEQVNSYSWGSHQEKVLAMQHPLIKIKSKNVTRPARGTSRLGGLPELPPMVSWPCRGNDPMVFLAQINLAEVHPCDLHEVLPPSGMLYFFCYFDAPRNGAGAGYDRLPEKGDFAVFYFDGPPEQLRRTAYPTSLPEACHFETRQMSFELHFNLPPADSWQVELAKLSEPALETLSDFNIEMGNYSEQLLGQPVPFTRDVTLDWAAAFLNLRKRKSGSQQQQMVQQLRPHFVNLLSLEMESGLQALGDAKMFFGIPRADLDRRAFSSTVLAIQPREDYWG